MWHKAGSCVPESRAVPSRCLASPLPEARGISLLFKGTGRGAKAKIVLFQPRCLVLTPMSLALRRAPFSEARGARRSRWRTSAAGRSARG